MVPQRLEPASRPPASPLGSCSCPITQGHPLPLLATSLPHPPPLLPLLTNPVKAQDDGASSSFDAPQPWPDDLRRNVCWQSRAVLCDGTRFLSLGSAGGFPYCKLLWAFWPSSKKTTFSLDGEMCIGSGNGVPRVGWLFWGNLCLVAGWMLVGGIIDGYGCGGDG